MAVAEENAAGGEIGAAPTCGSCGGPPAVPRHGQGRLDWSGDDARRVPAAAGPIGNLAKINPSISGAEVGCQGEIHPAAAMAAGAAAWLPGGTPRPVEYAAEMGIEHPLGLVRGPALGRAAPIPRIERHAFGAMRAPDRAEFAGLSAQARRFGSESSI
jgi:L-serine dehydratase